MKTILILIALLFLTGCTFTPVYLKHPVTGQMIECGSVAPATQNKCINDYRSQGFHRVPNLQ